jgi:glycerol-3-phosphate dehydrogenase
VDAACPDAPPRRTARLPLAGAPGAGGDTGPGVARRLAERYGSEAQAVQALLEGDPALAEPVALGITQGELVWAVRHEGALDAADLLDRRTRIGLVPEDRTAALAAAEAALRTGTETA